MHSRRFWVALGLSGVLLFALSFALRPLDDPVGQALLGQPALVPLAGALAFLGGISFIAPALVLGTLALLYFRRWWGTLRLVGAIGASEVVVRLAKYAFARPRPEYMLAHTGGYSFPSGHATVGAALAVLLVWFAAHHVRGRGLLIGILSVAFAWTVAMAGSRLVIGVHYLSDVVAGVGVGTACASAVLLASIEAQRRFEARQAPPTGAASDREDAPPAASPERARE